MLASLQGVQAAMDAKCAVGAGDGSYAQVVRDHLSFFAAFIRALRESAPDERLV